jgi:hypothetical protein
MRRASMRAGSAEKVIRAAFGRYCGSGPSFGQPSALQMIGEN